MSRLVCFTRKTSGGVVWVNPASVAYVVTEKVGDDEGTVIHFPGNSWIGVEESIDYVTDGLVGWRE